MEQNDFDLRMRSLLEDAEVKPSRRVWKAVSARLDAAGAPAVPATAWGWMKWAGAGLAFAAVLATGIFFAGTGDKTQQVNPIPTYSNIQPEKLLAREESPVPASSKETVEVRDVVRTRPAKKAGTAAEEIRIVETPQSNAGQTLVAEAAAPAAPHEEKVTENVAGSPDGSSSARSGNTRSEAQDAFARMEWEDSHAQETAPVQLFIEGALAGNESSYSVSSEVSHMTSPAFTTPKTGITELGDSSYGIPFTVGLGARFYLSRRLSIGTGLEYSLLSRSFEGKYTEVDPSGEIGIEATGTVMHSMHYAGIPLDIFYDIISGDKVKFYIYGGGAAEYCVANKYSIAAQNINWYDPVNSIQWSAGAGVGVEFKLADFLGIYVDPGARYYFKCGQPENVRTKHPFLVNFDAGLRFNF